MQTQHRYKGFTLIELLVVLMLIGLITGTAMLAVPDRGKKQLEQENKRLAALIELAKEEAVFQSRELALSFWRRGYGFLEFKDGKWQNIKKDKLFRAREIEDPLSYTLILEGLEVVLEKTEKHKAQVFILSSEEMTPFELTLDFDERMQQTISADAIGNITIDDMVTEDDF